MRIILLVALAGCAGAGLDGRLAAQLAHPPADLAERAQDLAQALVNPPADPALAAQLARETQTVAQLVAVDVAAARTPLAEEARAGRYSAFLESLAVSDTTTQLRGQISAAGAAKCALLDASTPFASWLASRYCAHFGITRVPLALGPTGQRFGMLEIDDQSTGESPSERTQLGDQLAAAFRASPWYAPGAPPLHATVTGSLGVTFTSKPVMRNVEFESEVEGAVTRGQRYGTCDPEYDQCDDPVTLRMPRNASYAATEEDGMYSAALHVDVKPIGIGASMDTSDTQSADTTDAAIPDANVHPTQASLPTADEFAVRVRDVLAGNFATELARAYREQACQDADRSYEGAAACAYADPAQPVPQLAAVFGTDAPLLRPLLQ